MITFNGTDLSNFFGQDETGKGLFQVIAITGRGPMTQNTTRLTVPGRPGSLYQSKNRPERVLGVRFYLNGQSLTGLQDKLDAFNDLLNVDEPVPIVFDDQPDKTFYGILDGEPDWEEIQDKGLGTLTFVCPDPNKYGAEQTPAINDPTGGDADPVINNKGTTDTYPVFTAEVLEPITLLQIVKEDAYMQVGQPVDVETEEVPELESILSDSLTSLEGWQALPGGDSVLDVLPGGIVGGAMHIATTADGVRYGIGVGDYGTNANGWVGPAVKKALSEALQDFRVAVNMSVLNEQVGVGKAVLFLADDTGTIFGALWMEDTTPSVNLNHARIALFDSNQNKRFLIDTTGDKFNVYNNFEGMLRLERRGNQFYAYSAQVDTVTGVHRARDTAPVFIDNDSLYQNELASVIIYIAKAKDYKTFLQTANDLSVFKINDIAANQIPYIAQSGDIITFDHVTKKIMLNGDPGLMQQKDFGATFFPLSKGENTLIVNPADAVKVTASYREADL